MFRQVFERRAYRARCGGTVRTVLDLGAYTGLSTRWFCDQYPEAEVVAVEPNPENIELLRHNAPRAHVVQAAVGARRGSAVLCRTSQGAWADTVTRDGRPIAQVAVVTVEDALDGRTPDVVKVDIEGSELEVFEAAGEWMRSVRLLFVETHDRYVRGCRRALDEALRRTGRPHEIRRTGGGAMDADLTITFPEGA